MERIDVSLGARSYPIFIGSGLLQHADGLLPDALPTRLLVITNDTIAPLYLEQVLALLRPHRQLDWLIVADGEQYKTIDTLNLIYTKALELGLGRDCGFVALGGGVIGDMVGYAAATYQRGISFIQIPTTLLAQVDSSVGGKTAVNHPLGKNMIGAFHQPKLVLMDMNTLATLPRREFAAGMAEVIKYGVLWDGAFFEWLENHADSIKALEPEALTYAIRRCCEIKAEVVALDETEQGCRALLNLGHTFGHAIEAEQGYGTWLHGEAVATGMVLAATLAVQLEQLSATDMQRIVHLIRRFELPITVPENMGFAEFVTHMRRDKKTLNGVIRVVLPTEIGHTEVFSSVTEAQLQRLFV
ncbi:MAG: 3-dehydroquinate synthase [Ferrimonas sp.]